MAAGRQPPPRTDPGLPASRPLPGQGRDAKPALVVSHERSGTHFLMNTLELNFGYLPWTDVDELLGTPVRSTADFLRFLFATPWPWQSVLKCHYGPQFFPFLGQLVRRFDVLHVVRDPAAALASFYRYVHDRGAEEGPTSPTFGEFLRARPSGRMLRYQAAPADSIAARWAAHTASWLEAGRRAGGAITVVRYEELDAHFAPTVDRLGERLRRAAGPPMRPDRDRKVILTPSAEHLPVGLDEADRAFLERATAATWAEVPRAFAGS